MMITPDALDRIHAWLDPNDGNQCAVFDGFMIQKGLSKYAGAHYPLPDIPVRFFDPERYNWPQGGDLEALLAEARHLVLFWKELDWVNLVDDTQVNWVKDFLKAEGIEKKESSTDVAQRYPDIENYHWPTDHEFSSLVRKMRIMWQRSGLGFDWIKLDSPSQTRWIHQQMINLQRAHDHVDLDRLPFAITNYNWGELEERKTLIQHLKSKWKFEQKFSWINRNDIEQCNWVNNYLGSRNIPKSEQVSINTHFNPYDYRWPSGLRLLDPLIAGMRQAWEEQTSLKWIDPDDQDQIDWITNRLIKYKINLLPAQNGQLFSINNFIWPEDKTSKDQTLKKLHQDWLKSGLSFDFIDQDDILQCEWANKYISEKYPRILRVPSVPLKKFDTRNYAIPRGYERIKLIERMQIALRQQRRRANSPKRSYSFELYPGTHAELERLSKALGRKLNETLEYLIHEGLRYQKSAEKHFEAELNKIKMNQALNNPKYRVPSPTEKTNTQLEKHINSIEKHYETLLQFSETILKQLSEATQLISAADLNNTELNEEQANQAEKFFTDFRKKHLKPLPKRPLTDEENDKKPLEPSE